MSSKGDLRARGIPEVDDGMKRRIHEMFDLGHIVGYGACKDMVRALYPDLDLSRLSPSKKDMNEFIIMIWARCPWARMD